MTACRASPHGGHWVDRVVGCSPCPGHMHGPWKKPQRWRRLDGCLRWKTPSPQRRKRQHDRGAVRRCALGGRAGVHSLCGCRGEPRRGARRTWQPWRAVEPRPCSGPQWQAVRRSPRSGTCAPRLGRRSAWRWGVCWRHRAGSGTRRRWRRHTRQEPRSGWARRLSSTICTRAIRPSVCLGAPAWGSAGWRHGMLDAWGVPAARRRALNPAVIVVHVSGVGPTGPYAHRLA